MIMFKINVSRFQNLVPFIELPTSVIFIKAAATKTAQSHQNIPQPSIITITTMMMIIISMTARN